MAKCGTLNAGKIAEVLMPVAIELTPEEQSRFQRSHRWTAAIKASLIAAAVIWLFPSGNPWTSFARPSGAHIMGRPVSADQSITLFSMEALPAHLAHFAVGVVYGLIIGLMVYRLRSWRAILAGIIVSLVLYSINFAAFRMFAPQFTGVYELNVAIAHVLFGGIAAGVMRGFLRPPMRLDESQPNPGPHYP
jgi:hypothetical protein